jgi:hypothetical protein
MGARRTPSEFSHSLRPFAAFQVKSLHTEADFTLRVCKDGGTAMAGKLLRIRRLMRFLALPTLVSVSGCWASGPEPTFQTAYSAIGSQIK